jgi:uncharacterized membrane protein YfcA
MIILIISIFLGLIVNIRNVRKKIKEENLQIESASETKDSPLIGEKEKEKDLSLKFEKKKDLDKDFTINNTKELFEFEEAKRIRHYEGRNFNPKKIGIFMFTIVMTILYSLIKGTTSIDSIAGLDVCQWEQVPIFFILVIIIILIQIYSIRVVKREEYIKVKYNLHYDHEIKFTNKKIAFLITFALLVGFLANLLGMGGGFVIFPMLIMIGVSPLVASATTIYIIFLAKIVAALLATFSEYLLLDYTLVEGFFVVILVVVFSKLADFLIRK